MLKGRLLNTGGYSAGIFVPISYFITSFYAGTPLNSNSKKSLHCRYYVQTDGLSQQKKQYQKAVFQYC